MYDTYTIESITYDPKKMSMTLGLKNDIDNFTVTMVPPSRFELHTVMNKLLALSKYPVSDLELSELYSKYNLEIDYTSKSNKNWSSYITLGMYVIMGISITIGVYILLT